MKENKMKCEINYLIDEENDKVKIDVNGDRISIIFGVCDIIEKITTNGYKDFKKIIMEYLKKN